MLTKRLIPSFLMHLEAAYQVYDKKGVDVTSFDSCGPVEMKHLAGPYDSHILFVFGMEDKPENHIAYSSPCIIKRSNSRPVVGYIMLNIK